MTSAELSEQEPGPATPWETNEACICGRGGWPDYEGPQEDCFIHGRRCKYCKGGLRDQQEWDWQICGSCYSDAQLQSALEA